MTSPIRLTYGSKNNAHKLLLCSENNFTPPTELEGLTDRPPGDITPTTIWFPSIGCQPIKEWWCLWWTEPDRDSTRAGMVRSEVAMWPRSEVSMVEDLTTTLCELSKKEEFPILSDDMALSIFERLLSQPKGFLVLHGNLELMPSIIIRLWKRLWSSARMDFSLRTALSPQQTYEPYIFSVPNSHIQQWSNSYCKLDIGIDMNLVSSGNRAAIYLTGNSDQQIEILINKIPPKNTDITYLSKIARIADRQDALNNNGNIDAAASLLRTLNSLDNAFEANDLYKEAINKISSYVTDAQSKKIKSLRNLILPSTPNITILRQNLSTWVSSNLADIPDEESIDVIHCLIENGAEPWWQSAILAGIKSHINKPELKWNKLILIWLSTPNVSPVFDSILSLGDTTEKHLIDALPVVFLDADKTNELFSQTRKRHWPELHAHLCVKTGMSVNDALDLQNEFNENPENGGLRYLIKNLPASEVIQEILNRTDNKLFDLAVSEITIPQPSILRLINVNQKSSRILWVKHIHNGGKKWEGDLPSDVLADLLNITLSKESTDGLLELIADDIAKPILNLPERSQIWTKLNNKEKQILLPEVAKLLISKITNENDFTEPEDVLANAVVNLINRETSPMPPIVCAVLTWNVQVNENRAINWIAGFGETDWLRFAQQIGIAISKRNWNHVAYKVYEVSKRVREAAPAIDSCYDLLSSFDKLMYICFHKKSAPQGGLTKLVADLGAELVPNCDELADIWERAGGEKKRLGSYYSASSCWYEAVKHAEKGAISEGILGLVKELHERFPHNQRLKDLKMSLNQSRLT